MLRSALLSSDEPSAAGQAPLPKRRRRPPPDFGTVKRKKALDVCRKPFQILVEMKRIELLAS